MKKYFLLLLFIAVQQTYPYKHELKIYRKPKVASFLLGTTAEIVSFGALGLAKSMTQEVLQKHRVLNEEQVMTVGVLGIVGITGTVASSLYLLSYLRWWTKLNKPILIFDEEGFTYEKPMGWFRGREYVRYRWKDVVSHWSEGVVDHWGRQLKKTWCYHINGEKEVLKVNVEELDIPDEIMAKVESLRQGRVRALWCD